MSDAEDVMIVLDESECWVLLRSHSLGRLAASAAGVIDIFPLNYYADGSTILMRTTPGTKLVEMTIHSDVAFEIDDFTDEEAVSVVVKGTAEWLDTRSAIEEADRAPLVSWLPTLKYVYVRITPTSVTGRRFVRGPEPERD
ncbi:nitroimidazol reductase NimA-like FMN-containing flavoprotein (pyridoxamine 5'-phosphate oxidase superfamily) [Glaciihabitans tibetensis]|uniref:Nitroimidazol reductase NimA-like FMN-containing flavoprotein (Pyridoxamine 5'-phosphate oxidase superfamily) n=1 Tax=Glaciihabitans tibetensis TaxID=1266600 RepID=A0A2T0VIW6_9MICO|nr:pyridoxamine 5'-phosphate oxidase family protein [Glaciihabitans tibetensis]PRY70159.1 nitroimidazol reductase NimA-like FMN-containing flavoprotein (pyridoxamine 5'-phosphate oxidase superfamily) [Glaciihabitans tibetensis]